MSFWVSSQPPLPLQAFWNLQAWSAVLHPPNPLQSLTPEQSWTTGIFLPGAALPDAGLVLASPAQPCRTAAPLNSPAMAAATRTFRDTFFIEMANSNLLFYATQPLACSSVKSPPMQTRSKRFFRLFQLILLNDTHQSFYDKLVY
jgi:hypothetical protein